ncbi:hypothetical protein ES703_58226 [subsurface metagenome]
MFEAGSGNSKIERLLVSVEEVERVAAGETAGRVQR